jgi:hypothetical protein
VEENAGMSPAKFPEASPDFQPIDFAARLTSVLSVAEGRRPAETVN